MKIQHKYSKIENYTKIPLAKEQIFIYTNFTDNDLEFRKYEHIDTKMTYNKKPKNKGV